MSYRSFSLIPALSNSILSDRFIQMDSLFSRLTGEKPVSENTSYNLVQTDNNKYELTISVPGYSQKELDISVLQNQLTIKSKKKENKIVKSDNKNRKKWLHKGILKNDFVISFNLEHEIKIKQAKLEKGLLILKFSYKIPEEEKPKKIEIIEDNQVNDVVESKK